MLPDVPDIAAFVRMLRERQVEAQIAGHFSVDKAVFHEGYLRLYGVYQDIVAARTSIEARAQAIDVSAVSRPITGVGVGAQRARSVVVANTSTPSLSQALVRVEADVAQLLQAMYDSYAAYRVRDEEAAAAFVRTTVRALP